METKKCSKCGIEKSINNFYKNGEKYRADCKECYKKIWQDKYYEKNKERLRLKCQEYRKQNKNKIKEYNRNYYQTNKEKISNKRKKYLKDYYANNKEKWKKYNNTEERKIYQKEYNKKYREINRKELNKKNKNKRENDIKYKMISRTRNLVNMCFKKNKYKKNSKTHNIIGCDYDFFVNYLLKTFKNNYGYEYNNDENVQIDHIIPLSTANSVEEVIKLNHYTNLQLLKEEDNRKKSNKLDWRISNDNPNEDE